MIHGLYAVTDTALSGSALRSQAEQALRGGAAVLQYRDKSGDASQRKRDGEALLRLCRDYGALFLVNDDVVLADRIGADGVHLGRADADVDEARAALGSKAVIGVSCYNQLLRAVEAQSTGADYVAFGRFFPSVTKPDAVQAEIELLRQAKSRLAIPIVAIGGITPDNGAMLVEAGADALAVIHGLFGQSDIAAAANRYAALFAA